MLLYSMLENWAFTLWFKRHSQNRLDQDNSHPRILHYWKGIHAQVVSMNFTSIFANYQYTYELSRYPK